MPITPLDTVKNQFESAARRQGQAVVSDVRRQTSIVRAANALLGKGRNALEKGTREARAKAERSAEKGGVYVQKQPVVRAPDGYVRRSPVQPVVEAADYRKRCVRRCVGAVLGILAAMGAMVLLFRHIF